MLIATIVLLSILLVVSIIGNVFLFRIGENLKMLNDVNERRIVEIKHLAQTVYQDMKNLDDKQMFEKDDEVGSIFQEMADILKWFNEFVQTDDQIVEVEK